jgi:hypothetical protein
VVAILRDEASNPRLSCCFSRGLGWGWRLGIVGVIHGLGGGYCSMKNLSVIGLLGREYSLVMTRGHCF